MNNKKLGTDFENEMCEILAHMGYWVHFIVPDSRGAQPFDIIAVKDGKAYAIDCKTSASKRFPFSRLEENQILAFEKWMKCGNSEPCIAVKYDDKIYLIYYLYLKKTGVVKLGEEDLFIDL